MYLHIKYFNQNNLITNKVWYFHIENFLVLFSFTKAFFLTCPRIQVERCKVAHTSLSVNRSSILIGPSTGKLTKEVLDISFNIEPIRTSLIIVT